MPIFSTAFANSSGSTVPELFKSKYLKDFYNTYSSDYIPVDFYASLFLSSLSKLYKIKVSKLSSFELTLV
jgi:hypothetical protein